MTLRSLLPFGRDASQSLATRTEQDPFFSLHHDLSRAFEDVFRDFGGLGSRFGTALDKAAFTPHLDISEDDQSYTVAVELPGVTEEDINLEVRDGTLLIRGEKKFEKDEKDKKGYHLVERSYGSFLRTVPLGYDIEPEAVEAVFKKGVLNIIVPKPAEEQTKARKIDIQSR